MAKRVFLSSVAANSPAGSVGLKFRETLPTHVASTPAEVASKPLHKAEGVGTNSLYER